MTPGRSEVDRQLPIGDEIFLDHIAHFVPDRDAARAALTRAGFAPAPISIQVNPDPAGGRPKPTGTGNVTAMLARGYVEILFKTSDTPIAREVDAAIARYPGLHLAAFAVADAAVAHRRLGEAGFRTQPLIAMQRPVETVAGPDIAAFTLARIEAGQMPEGRIQMLTHRTEHTVWQPRWLDHPNGARKLVALTIAVADVGEAAARFARFTGRAAVPCEGGQTVALDRGRVELVRADAFRGRFPEIAIPSLPFMGACTIAVTSLATADKVLRHGGITPRYAADQLIAPFPHELGMGVWVLESAG